jgi:hypothetical protein
MHALAVRYRTYRFPAHVDYTAKHAMPPPGHMDARPPRVPTPNAEHTNMQRSCQLNRDAHVHAQHQLPSNTAAPSANPRPCLHVEVGREVS